MTGTLHHLHGIGWRWSPLWRFAFDGTGQASKVWIGREVLVNETGEHLRRQDDGTIAVSSYGTLIERDAPPPDRAPPSEEELEEIRAERRRALLMGGAQ